MTFDIPKTSLTFLGGLENMPTGYRSYPGSDTGGRSFVVASCRCWSACKPSCELVRGAWGCSLTWTSPLALWSGGECRPLGAG